MPNINEVLLKLKVEGGQVVASQVDKVGDSVEGLGGKAEDTGNRSGAMMGAIGKAARVGGAILGAFGLQSVKAGLQFNESFESARMSYSVFLGSAKKGQQFMDRLGEVSSKSPLRKTDYMEAAKQMLAFGASGKQTLQTLKAVNMAVVGSGKGADDMLRIVNILGQMKAQGKVSADTVTRLGQAGVPIDKILKKQLGLTAEQIKNIGKEGIGADKVIRAVNKGWTKQFKKAYGEAEGTLGFQWANLVKSFEQFQREALVPLAEWLASTGLPAVTKFIGWILKLPQAAKSGIIGIALLAGAAALIGGPWTLAIAAIGAAVFAIIKWRKEIGRFLEPIVGWITNAANNVANWVSTAARNVSGFVSSLLPVKLAVLMIKGAVSLVAQYFRVAWPLISFAVMVASRIIRVYAGIAWDYIKVGWGIIKRLGAIVGNVVGIVSNLLRGKWGNAWKNAKALVGNMMGLIKDSILGMLRLVARIPGRILGVFKGLPGKIRSAASGMFNGVKDALRSALNWVINKFNSFLSTLRSIQIQIPGGIPGIGGETIGIPTPSDIPAAALGGNVRSPGSVLIGEQGPEILSLPRGARVTPLSGPNAPVVPRVEVPVYLDGREIARAFSDRIQNAAARA